MEQSCFTFNTFNNYASSGICDALKNFSKTDNKPVFVCIGSDLVLGDSLGPLVGTFIKDKNINAYVYGTLNFPITAKEIGCIRTHIRQLHPNSPIIAIDAAVGEQDDIGLLKVVNGGIKPGLGVDKKLGTVGDLSIIGVVAGKSVQNYNLFNLTRLNLIYKMANVISNGIEQFVNSFPFISRLPFAK